MPKNEHYFQEPVRMQVHHPSFGVVEVLAYCETDARLQAGITTGCGWEVARQGKVAIETRALREAGYLNQHLGVWREPGGEGDGNL